MREQGKTFAHTLHTTRRAYIQPTHRHHAGREVAHGAATELIQEAENLVDIRKLHALR